MATGIQVVFDCADPDRLARFWATALHYRVQDPPDGFTSWEAWLADAGVPESEWNSASAIVDPDGAGPRIYFQRVPEGKVVKNRLHLDVIASGWGTPVEHSQPIVEAEAEQLVARGATVVANVEKPGDFFIVMQDPEGNEFCVC